SSKLRDVRIQLCLRLRHGQAGLQTSNDRWNHSQGSIGRNRKRSAVEAGCEPHLDVGIQCSPRMTKSRRHHAHDRVHVLVESNFSSDNLRIRAEIAAPKPVADYERLEESRNRIPGSVNAAKLWLGPK